VFYASLYNVCLGLGIHSGQALGAVIEFEFSWLGSRSICAAYATEAQALNGQTQAYYAAKKAAGAKGKRFVRNPRIAVLHKTESEKIMEGSAQCVGSNVKPNRFRYYRIKPNMMVPGITQVELGKRMGKSDRTISRRLSNKNRKRLGIEPLHRRRVIQEFDEATENRLGVYLDCIKSTHASVQIGDRPINVGLIKIGDEPIRPYRLLTNIYASDFELLPGRRERRRLNRLGKKLENKGF
jgi:hypothetical protein